MIETLIVPGLNGSPAGHWQHHWASDDPRADLVEQEDWQRPVFADWLYALEARIAESAPGVILVAHSLGCSLVASLAGRPAASHVGGALLVAPADLSALSDRHPSVRSFAACSTELPFASIVVASRNDPFMAFEGAEDQAEIWGSAVHDLGEAGHINIASGFGPWADASTLADGLRGRAWRASPVRRAQIPSPPSQEAEVDASSKRFTQRVLVADGMVRHDRAGGRSTMAKIGSSDAPR